MGAPEIDPFWTSWVSSVSSNRLALTLKGDEGTLGDSCVAAASSHKASMDAPERQKGVAVPDRP